MKLTDKNRRGAARRTGKTALPFKFSAAAARQALRTIEELHEAKVSLLAIQNAIAYSEALRAMKLGAEPRRALTNYEAARIHGGDDATLARGAERVSITERISFAAALDLVRAEARFVDLGEQLKTLLAEAVE